MVRERMPCVYLLASIERGTLYVGVTTDLVQRIPQHKHNLVDGFTKKHGVHLLVWYEMHEAMESAIQREKSIKALEAHLENRNDRMCQSRLARSVSGYHLKQD